MVFKPFDISHTPYQFENDVKMYGIQTVLKRYIPRQAFENDVKMYGIQTPATLQMLVATFENDVKMYGIQTNKSLVPVAKSLRMM